MLCTAAINSGLPRGIIGLNHSAEQGSVMREGQPLNGRSMKGYTVGRELGEDDRAGMQSLYGKPSAALAAGE